MRQVSKEPLRVQQETMVAKPFVTLPLIAGILIIGSIAALNPAALGAIVVILGVVFVGVFLLLHLRTALTFSFFLVMLAETKFRERDPNALLSGDIDAQVAFELFLYGIILLFILMNISSSWLEYHKPTLVERILFGYVVLAIVSSFWSDDPRITAVRGMQLFILYTLCFLAVRVFGSQRVLRILAVTVLFYVLLCSLMALSIPWPRTHIGSVGRFSWFSVHPILAASYTGTAITFIIAEALFAPGSWWRRIMGLPLWLYITPLGLILLATRSRGALIAVVIAAAALSVRKYVNPWVAGFVGYILLASSTIALGLGLYSAGAVGGMLNEQHPLIAFVLREQSAEDFVSVSGRAELWHSVYAMFLDRPIFGFGYSASRNLLLKVLPWAGHAHGGLAETLLGLGIVGTALIWFALGRTLLSSLLHTSRTVDPMAWYQASILGILLFSLLNSFVNPSFGGAPGSEVLLFFAAVFAHDGLRGASSRSMQPLEAGQCPSGVGVDDGDSVPG
ncbi:MAG: O-antigen ligase family protein [Candidatus Entotheonellia bacterium]